MRCAELGRDDAHEDQSRAQQLQRRESLAEHDGRERDREQRLERRDDRGLRRSERPDALEVEHDGGERRDEHDAQAAATHALGVHAAGESEPTPSQRDGARLSAAAPRCRTCRPSS